MPHPSDIRCGPKPTKLRIPRSDCGRCAISNHCPLYHFAVASGVDPNHAYTNPHLPSEMSLSIPGVWDQLNEPRLKREQEVISLFSTFGVTVEFVD